jgi:carbamoyltransferase
MNINQNQFLLQQYYRIKYYKNFNNLISKSVQILKEKKIIFWFQGKMEWGPRALGNRSILADPNAANIKNLLNLKIKNREKFRPFALTVLEDSAEDYFHMNKQKSPNMNIVFRAKKITKNRFPGVVHVDGTSRVQTINRSNNYKFYKLIKEFNKKTNCPMLINTSLNINAPIALSPHDAFIYFLRSGVETIVINNWIIELKKN